MSNAGGGLPTNDQGLFGGAVTAPWPAGNGVPISGQHSAVLGVVEDTPASPVPQAASSTAPARRALAAARSGHGSAALLTRCCGRSTRTAENGGSGRYHAIERHGEVKPGVMLFDRHDDLKPGSASHRLTAASGLTSPCRSNLCFPWLRRPEMPMRSACSAKKQLPYEPRSETAGMAVL